MQPGLVQSARFELRDHSTRRGLDAISKHTLNRELCNFGLNDVAVVILKGRTFRVTLTQLNNVVIVRERFANLRPIGQQRFTAPTHKSQVHTRRCAQAFRSVVISRMEEIAVPIDVDEALSACEPQAMQAAEENAAIAANHYRKSTPLEDVPYFLRQLK